MNYSKQIYTDFVADAMRNISDDPWSRLSEVTKDTIDRDYFVVDGHVHVFDGACVDVRYVITRMLEQTNRQVKKAILRFLSQYIPSEEFFVDDNKTGTLEEEEILRSLENVYVNKGTLEKVEVDEFLKEFDSFLETDPEVEALMSQEDFDGGAKEIIIRFKEVIEVLLYKKMDRVYKLFQKYQIANNFNEDGASWEQVSIQLGMDLEMGWGGSNIRKSFQDQVTELKELSKKHAVIPFLPLHPKRAQNTGAEYTYNELYDTFLREFDKDAESNYFGVKIYPALGYCPSDEVLMPIFEVCAAKGIPVLTHCGGNMISTFENSFKVNRKGVEATINEGSRSGNASLLNHPKEWSYVLEEFPSLRLNLGHFGGITAWKDFTDRTYERITTIIDQMITYSNVYADFSYNFNDKKASEHFGIYLDSTTDDRKIIKDRVFFGTDFWVVLPNSNILKDQGFFMSQTEGYHDQLFKENVMKYLGLDNSKPDLIA